MSKNKKKNNSATNPPLGGRGASPIIINQIEVKPANRQILDIEKWRIALRSADMGRRTQLFNLYEDILIDGVLGDAIDKRLRAITGANLTFQYADGSESEEMISLIDTDEFEYLIEEIASAIFWEISLIEPTFDTDGMHVYSVPRKHIRPDTKSVAKLENDPEGSIPYDEADVIEVFSRKHKHGLILRACPYAIFKRGGFGDWAQMVELFGMPQRVGKYNIYDVEARKALQDAFNQQGAAATLIVPKETDIETTINAGSGGGQLYNDFIKSCDEQILITILSQTMTTKDGASRSQGQVHKEVEEEVNLHDLRFVQRILNHKFKPILERRGYPVKDGSFVFPKALEGLSVEELVSLSDILDIPAYYFQERYGIPAAEKTDVIAKRRQSAQSEPPQPIGVEPERDPSKKDNEPPKGQKPKAKSRLRDFFAFAPTKERGNFATRLIDSITGRVRLSDKYSINLNKLLQEALEEIYGNEARGDEQPIVSEPLFNISNNALQHGINSVLSDPEFGKKNEEFINEFRHNTAVFAAFKNHRQTGDIVALLYDENGNLRSFREFKKLALKISKDYNVNWLQTEYNTAVRSARNAVNYRKWLETEHLYPNLEYLESTASHPRASHLSYVGTVLPIRHPWWDKHMPPSAWNCACSVRPTDKEVTPVPGEEFVPPVFQNNPGKTAEFVNLKEHPYIKGVCPYFDTCKRRTAPRPNAPSGLADNTPSSGEPEVPPIIPQCGICELANTAYLAKRREEYLKILKPLLKKNLIRKVEKNKSIKIVYKSKGLGHIANDVLSTGIRFTKKDLSKLHTYMSESVFIKSSGLKKERKDDIVRFYYFWCETKKVYYNVAETKRELKNGRILKDRFLYSITKEI